MAAPRNHNGGPPIDDGRAIAAIRIRAAIANLLERAEAQARGDVHRLIVQRYGDIAPSIRFAPSRLRKCPTDRTWRDAQADAALTRALAARQPQIDRLRRKLARLESTTMDTDEGLQYMIPGWSTPSRPTPWLRRRNADQPAPLAPTAPPAPALEVFRKIIPSRPASRGE